MPGIATLTLNPTIDIAYEVERVFHTHKIRTTGESSNPGGGGINVARVFVRLGGSATCYYMAGGATGPALSGLLDRHQLVHRRIDIEGATRVSTAVFETSSGHEYRFVPNGPEISQEEWQSCLDALDDCPFDMLVASGSLPPGVPDDFYARLARKAAAADVPFVLDSSGEGLREGLAGGGVYLVKPSLGELRGLVGEQVTGVDEVSAAAMEIVGKGQARLVAVTLGHEGAVLARKEGVLFIPSLPIEAKSAVGAGDSFVAGMVFALVNGWDEVEAFRFGIASGAAAVLTPGTDLARPEQIRQLFQNVETA